MYLLRQKKDLTTEHILPRDCGGEDVMDHVVRVCKSCNSSKGGKRLYEWKGLKEKDRHHRIAEGKYLKYLYSFHEKRRTLDVTNVRELCPHCNMRSCCERDGTVEKLSVYCIEGCFHRQRGLSAAVLPGKNFLFFFHCFRFRFRGKEGKVGGQVPVPADGRQAHGERDHEARHEAGGGVDPEVIEHRVRHAPQQGSSGIQFPGAEHVGNVAGEHVAQQAPRHAGADAHHHGNGGRVAVQVGFFRADHAEEGQHDGVRHADGAHGRRIFLGDVKGHQAGDDGGQDEDFPGGQRPVHRNVQQEVAHGSSPQSRQGAADNHAEQVHFHP